ncbi:MAG TPA: DNA replication and repair protein RecF [Candidatus Saccharimonadales bacterium]|nr:DNA replication and repair protein RecF [Candidatus Saccharimonadales bacterium]
MLGSLHLQNFRSYKKASFEFATTTLIIGPNTAGKTNLIEAVFLLSTGKSFKGGDEDAIMFTEEVARVSTQGLEVVFANQAGQGRFVKKYLVNGVSKRRADFVGNLPAVLFTPLDLELITNGPSMRRRYFDFVLEQTDSDYAHARAQYEKAIRARNRLLEEAKKRGHKSQQIFSYWDDLLIQNGQIITQKREEYTQYLNRFSKDVFDFTISYDKSVISKERLLQYDRAEVDATITLVGPHRDDFEISMFVDKEAALVKTFGSRGQQRLAILQLKIIELAFLEEKLGERPMLLLDDIFSELDEGHIDLVLEMIGKQQTILTTTHKEFVKNKFSKGMHVIELGK